jgi:4-carboxymuconolactone decarboxylase
MDVAFSSARQRIGDVAPKLAALTDDVLFADVWERPGLSKRDRSLVTVAALVALYRTNEMAAHMKSAIEHGLTADEMIEAITHLAFYVSWPNAQTAVTTLRGVLDDPSATEQGSEMP